MPLYASRLVRALLWPAPMPLDDTCAAATDNCYRRLLFIQLSIRCFSSADGTSSSRAVFDYSLVLRQHDRKIADCHWNRTCLQQSSARFGSHRDVDAPGLHVSTSSSRSIMIMRARARALSRSRAIDRIRNAGNVASNLELCTHPGRGPKLLNSCPKAPVLYSDQSRNTFSLSLRRQSF